MVIKTTIKIFFVLGLLYGGWYSYEFINAWFGIFIIGAVFTGLAAYAEYGYKKSIKDKKE